MRGSDPLGAAFFYDREEIENYAAALEATARTLYSPEVRSGECYLESTMRSMEILEGFARELILEANEQHQDEPLPGQLALDRDAIRCLCYGLLHVFKVFKDGKDETVDGETPSCRFAGIYSGFWWLVGRNEEEERQEVHDRLERQDRFERSMERQFGERTEEDLQVVAVARRSLASLEEPLTSVISGLTERPEGNHTQLLRLLKEQARRLLAFVERAPRDPSNPTDEQILVPVYRLRHLGELLQDGTERQSAMVLQEALGLLREVLSPDGN